MTSGSTPQLLTIDWYFLRFDAAKATGSLTKSQRAGRQAERQALDQQRMPKKRRPQTPGKLAFSPSIAIDAEKASKPRETGKPISDAP
jgi:hypothetical protein